MRKNLHSCLDLRWKYLIKNSHSFAEPMEQWLHRQKKMRNLISQSKIHLYSLSYGTKLEN